MKADYGGSHTPKELRDRWQTPLPLFTALDAEFGFYLDVAADKNNALCSHYLTEKDDSLNCDWESYGAIWINHPILIFSHGLIKQHNNVKSNCNLL